MKYIQAFRTIGFTKLQDGEEYYNFTSTNNSEKLLVYHREEDKFFFERDRSEIEVRPEAKEQFHSARRDFLNILWDIRKSDSTFRLAKSEHCVIAYRKEFRKNCEKEKYLYDKTERNDFYRFVIFRGSGNVLQWLCTFDKLFENFNFDKSAIRHPIQKGNIETIAGIRDGSFPLYQSAEKHDRHLYLTMKYIAGIATQAEADEATAIDGKTRFVPEEKVYGEGVTVGDVEQICPSFFNRSERYSCTVAIGSREWKATWRPREHRLLIWQHFRYADATIIISDEIFDSLQRQAVKKYQTGY